MPLGVDKDKAVLGLVEQRRKEAASARRRYESDWFLDLAFFEGHQWLAWDGNRLFRPSIPRGRLTLTDNRVQPIIRTEVAKLTKARPGWQATPRVATDEASQHAATSELLLEHAYDHLNFAYHRREAVTWSRITGAGFVKYTWDPTIGKGGVDFVVDDEGKPIRNPKTRRPARRGELPETEGARTQKVGGGDVRLSTRSPFDIYPDPLATSMEDLRWLIDEQVVSPEFIQQRYGMKVQPDTPAQVGVVQSRLQGQEAGGKQGVRLWEMWEMPSAAAPGGRRVVWCEGQLLEDEKNVAGGYVMFSGIQIPGRFWPGSVVTQLRPVQARRNKLLSQIAENAARFSNPSILIDSLSNVTFHGTVGEQISYTAGIGEKPSYMQPPQLPAQVFQLLAETEQSMREISGQFEVSQGTVPAGVTAASAISLLQEQDATRLGPDVESMEVALGKLGQGVLELMARFYTTARVTTIVGEEGVIAIDTFRTAADFQVPDVTVQAGSTFPRSVAAKQAAIRDILNMMLQYGVPIPPDALARTLRDMDVGGLDKIIGSFTADQAQVAREHIQLQRDGELVVNPLVDNSAVHLTAHQDFAKTAKFRGLPVPQQQRLMQHIQDHQAQVVKEASAAPPAGINPPLPQGGGGAPAVPTEASGNAVPAGDMGSFAGDSTV